MMNRAFVEAASSTGVRNAIVSRHEMLRGLLAETVELTQSEPSSTRERLRARARDLCLTFEEHLSFEERALPTALHDVIGWGAVLREQIEEDHARQRRDLASAWSALEPDGLSWLEIADRVREFATALLDDLEREDAHLVNADLDAIATDSEGG